MALLPLKTQFKGPARGDGEATLSIMFDENLLFVHLLSSLYVGFKVGSVYVLFF